MKGVNLMIEIKIADFETNKDVTNPVLKVKNMEQAVKLLDIIFKSGYDAGIRDDNFPDFGEE